jgi:DUF4097 and DUF4098 domain-containing protein YvlB
MKKFISIMAVLAACVGIAQAQAQSADRMTVTLSDPDRPGLLKVNLINGEINVRAHSGRDIIIESPGLARSRPAVTPDGLKRIDSASNGWSVVEEKNVITISTRAFANSANLDIQVPMKTNLILGTINGETLTVEGVEGDIEVSNMNGQVRLNGVSGSVVAYAGNGNLSAVLREFMPNKAMSFMSMNGNVDVTLPASAKATLRIHTDFGDAWTDFDLQKPQVAAPTVEDRRNRGGPLRIVPDQTVTGTINGGGTDVAIRTLHGNIYLRKAK